jgi:hypothetical protein
LEKVFRGWKKFDKEDFEEFISILTDEYNKITSGLYTTSEYENIRFLQGIGNFLSIILAVANKISKNEEV